MDIQEAIRILKENKNFIGELNTRELDLLMETEEKSIQGLRSKAIETVLNKLEKLQAENKQLKEQLKQWDKFCKKSI